jgi:hypothetical protein
MVYVDRVEDATAKAAVLPRLLSVPLVPRPMKAARLCLQAKIAKLIGKSLSPVKAAKDEEEGPWLKHFRGIEDKAGENKVDIAAELVLGLIFAAHKNDSIGSAQSLVFFLRRLCALSRGETVCFAHQIINTDPTVWGPDASLYRTGRFSESTSVDLPYLAFSKGVHKCPGGRIAIALMQIMLSLFLNRGAELDDGPIPMLCFDRAT